MYLKSELQYFPTIISSAFVFKSSTVDYCLYDPFRKMTFRNRCLIAGANGIITLTVPVLGGREQKVSYGYVLIDHRKDWRRRHWRTILSAYGRAPFFEHYSDGLEKLFDVHLEKLADWNLEIMAWLSRCLKIDLPNRFSPEESTSSIPVMKKADIYLSDKILPKNYLNGKFLLTPPRYRQAFEERQGFYPNLSILDLLFCCGPWTAEWLRLAGGQLWVDQAG